MRMADSDSFLRLRACRHAPHSSPPQQTAADRSLHTAAHRHMYRYVRTYPTSTTHETSQGDSQCTATYVLVRRPASAHQHSGIFSIQYSVFSPALWPLAFASAHGHFVLRLCEVHWPAGAPRAQIGLARARRWPVATGQSPVQPFKLAQQLTRSSRNTTELGAAPSDQEQVCQSLPESAARGTSMYECVQWAPCAGAPGGAAGAARAPCRQLSLDIFQWKRPMLAWPGIRRTLSAQFPDSSFRSI